MNADAMSAAQNTAIMTGRLVYDAAMIPASDAVMNEADADLVRAERNLRFIVMVGATVRS